MENFHQNPQENSLENNRKEQFRRWGKLGGRPKSERKKSVQISVSMSGTQKEKLDTLAKSAGVNPQEFIRRMIDNEKPSDPERNKTLLEYRTNFSRISNYFERNIWDDAEKESFKELLSKTISEIRKAIQ